MYLAREDLNRHDITLLSDMPQLMAHLQARMIAGVDVENEIDVFPIDQAERIEISARMILHDA